LDIIVIIIGTVSFAKLGCLRVVIAGVMGPGEQQRRSLGGRQRPIIDQF
jgi:hypothetical protein